MVRRGLALMSILTIGCLIGCQDEQETNLFKAQACVNQASADTVSNCLNGISGDNSKRANVLRCSAAFIAEGIDESAIVNAIENIDGNEGGDPTAPAVAALAMSNTSASTNALSVCQASESEALTALANFANLATAMKSLLNFADGASSADIEAAIDDFNPATDAAELGAAVIASQESLCNTDNGLFKDEPICIDINQAITAHPGNADAVGDALIANIDNQSN